MMPMTIIDQRILIPTGPDAVWEILSDINSNPKWQADCQSISFLTSMRAGPGVRWRYTSPNGQEYVVETTAWYDRLGYEYTFIDGVPFRSSKGTIRLQEIAEGTVVQWTLNYEIGGMLAGMRNTLSIRRQFDGHMVDSLKALWTYMKESGKARQAHEAKSLMRDALDYEARAQYVSRHPSKATEADEPEQSPPAATAEPAPAITEPPIADDDTRPNPALASDADAAPEVATEAEPQIKPEIPDEEPARSDELSRFKRPAPGEVVEQATPIPTEIPEESPVEVWDAVEPPAQTVPEIEEFEDANTPIPDMELTPKPELEPSEPAQTQDKAPTIEQASNAESDDIGPKIDTAGMDTREISIWEVFGVPSPTDTERMKAVQEEPVKAPETPSDTPVDVDEATPEFELVVEPEPVEQPEKPRLGEATRPVVVSAAEPVAGSAVILRGYRLRARRQLVTLRRH